MLLLLMLSVLLSFKVVLEFVFVSVKSSKEIILKSN